MLGLMLLFIWLSFFVNWRNQTHTWNKVQALNLQTYIVGETHILMSNRILGLHSSYISCLATRKKTITLVSPLNVCNITFTSLLIQRCTLESDVTMPVPTQVSCYPAKFVQDLAALALIVYEENCDAIPRLLQDFFRHKPILASWEKETICFFCLCFFETFQGEALFFSFCVGGHGPGVLLLWRCWTENSFAMTS